MRATCRAHAARRVARPRCHAADRGHHAARQRSRSWPHSRRAAAPGCCRKLPAWTTGRRSAMLRPLWPPRAYVNCWSCRPTCRRCRHAMCVGCSRVIRVASASARPRAMAAPMPCCSVRQRPSLFCMVRIAQSGTWKPRRPGVSRHGTLNWPDLHVTSTRRMMCTGCSNSASPAPRWPGSNPAASATGSDSNRRAATLHEAILENGTPDHASHHASATAGAARSSVPHRWLN